MLQQCIPPWCYRKLLRGMKLQAEFLLEFLLDFQRRPPRIQSVGRITARQPRPAQRGPRSARRDGRRAARGPGRTMITGDRNGQSARRERAGIDRPATTAPRGPAAAAGRPKLGDGRGPGREAHAPERTRAQGRRGEAEWTRRNLPPRHLPRGAWPTRPQISGAQHPGMGPGHTAAAWGGLTDEFRLSDQC